MAGTKPGHDGSELALRCSGVPVQACGNQDGALHLQDPFRHPLIMCWRGDPCRAASRWKSQVIRLLAS